MFTMDYIRFSEELKNSNFSKDEYSQLLNMLHDKRDEAICNVVTKLVVNKHDHYLSQFVLATESKFLRFENNENDYHNIYYKIELHTEKFICCLHKNFEHIYEDVPYIIYIWNYEELNNTIVMLNFDDECKILEDLEFDLNDFNEKNILFERCNIELINSLANEYSYSGPEFIKAIVDLLLEIYFDDEIKSLNYEKNNDKVY